MTTAALDPLAQGVLRALFELAQLDCPADAGTVARVLTLAEIGRRAPAQGSTSLVARAPQGEPRQRGDTWSAGDVARALLVLDARGLVAAERARLTLRGLAEAARCAPLSLERAAWFAQLRRQAVQFQYAERLRVSGGCGRG